MKKHVILGTDFSKAVSEIIDNAGMLKTIGVEKITLIHVLNLRDMIMVEKFTIEELEKKLSQQKAHLEQKGFEVDAEFIYGIPSVELEKKRKNTGADLIVVGSHGKTHSSAKIGSTASDILQNIKAPVLMVHLVKTESEEEKIPAENFHQYEQIIQQLEAQEPDWEISNTGLCDHILLPTDFSDFAEKAFQWLKKQDVKLPKLTLMHVQDEVKIGKHLEHKLEEFNKIDTERLYRLKQSFLSSHPETDVEVILEYGKPTQVILKHIKEKKVTLAVMGSQGRGYISEIFIGSVSHQVARNAGSNVLILPITND